MTKFDAPRLQVSVGEAKRAPFDLALEVTPSGEETRVRAQMDAQPRGLMAPIVKIMWPLLMRGREGIQAASGRWLRRDRERLAPKVSDSRSERLQATPGTLPS